MKMNPISDASRKRAVNRCAILRALHFQGPLQRSELSRELLIRKSSVTSITTELIRRGFIVEEKPHNFFPFPPRRHSTIEPHLRAFEAG